ncbi:MAG: hypothetical protein QF473_35305 [Planctomycetota bacterium]|jgi:hypothetical protein|nr:hypothetical protein [Planctomycetota bacterium]
MNRTITLPVLTSFALSLLTSWAEEAKKPAAEQDPVKVRHQELYKKRSDLSRQIGKLRYSLMRSDAAKTEQEALGAASKAYKDAGNADAGVIAANKVTAQAQEELNALLQKKFDENAEAKEVREVQEKNAARNLELRYKIDLAKFKLTSRYSPISLQVDKDPEVTKARSDAYKTKDRAERNKAQSAYYALRKQKIAAIPEGKVLHKEIEDAEAEIKEMSDGWRGREDKLRGIRRAIEKSEDADLAAARKKYSDARTAGQAAWNTDELKALKAKYGEAQKALYAKAAELVAQDENGKALLADQEATNKEYEELRKQRRGKGRKKAQRPAKKEDKKKEK